MNHLEKKYFDLIYEWNQDMIDDQNMAIAQRIHSKELYDYSSRHCDLIWEATYFDDIDDVFEDWFIQKFNEFRDDCIKKAKNNEEYEYELKLNVSEIAKHLSLYKLKNYKNFHQFIHLLYRKYSEF